MLSFSDGIIPEDYMDLSDLEAPIKTNNKAPGKIKNEIASRIIKVFIALSPKTYSFKDYTKNTKEKGIKNCNKAKHGEFYNALNYNTPRTVDECRILKVDDNMTTTKTSKIRLNTFDDKRFYVNNIKSYPHDENLYLFRGDLVSKIYPAPLDFDKNQLVKNFLELAINDDRKLIEADNRLYNDL